MRVLLIEDSLDLAANVGEFLKSRGHDVDYAHNGHNGLRLADAGGHDAIVLDIGLPGIDGLSLCRQMRNSTLREVPIIMLTALDTEHDKLSGFDAGADDYLTKPFSLRELLARIEALVRRTSKPRQVLQVGNLTYDLQSLIIQRGTRSLLLGPTGLRILEHLMRASPGIVTREQMERLVWGSEPPGTEAALRGHIHIIRTAIEAEGETKLLHTIHGIGYRITEDVS